MKVDPDLLASAAMSVGRCAESFGSRLDALEATVSTGNPWGKDEQGSIFGAVYAEVLGHAMDVYGSHIGQLVQAAEVLAGWAQQVWQTEQQNTLEIDQAASGLGG